MTRWTAWLLTGLLAFTLISCKKDAAAPGGSATQPAKGGKLTIAVIPKSMGGDFWETVRKGAVQAQEELGVDMLYQGTLNETDITQQNNYIETMVNRGVAGIALAPLNFEATKDAVDNAVQAKIPVVIFDSDVNTKNRVSYVATDNTRGGQMAAEHMIQLLGGKGNVVVLRYLQGTGSTEARAKGFIETAKAGGLNVLADPWPDDGSIAGSKKAATNTLERFVKDNKLQVDGIFACNLYSAMGMLGALDDLRNSNVEVKAKFIGFDSSLELVKGLDDGRCAALIVQNPQKMGYLAVQTLVKHLRGQTVAPAIDTGAELVTKQRLDQEKPIRELVGKKDQ